MTERLLTNVSLSECRKLRRTDSSSSSSSLDCTVCFFICWKYICIWICDLDNFLIIIVTLDRQKKVCLQPSNLSVHCVSVCLCVRVSVCMCVSVCAFCLWCLRLWFWKVGESALVIGCLTRELLVSHGGAKTINLSSTRSWRVWSSRAADRSTCFYSCT